MIEIYSDGAFASSRNQGVWAYVVTKKDIKIYSDYEGVLNTTNNRMEIQGVISALKYCIKENIQECIIYTDSMYVIGTMTKNWKRNKNNDLWEILDKYYSKVTVSLSHVKGHNGDKWNEYCDMLAVHASNLKINL
jgi:ribonuclease HI